MAYLLDSDVFIRAKNDHYGFKFCPAFWDWVMIEHAEGRLYSVEQVRAELMEQEDELSDWVENQAGELFVQTPPGVLKSLGKVSQWASGGRYTATAVNAFLSKADYYLVGVGLARGDTVVTHEVPAKSANKIKIPDACIELGVSFMSPFVMLRESRARFVLER
jgi:hypothetical protein